MGKVSAIQLTSGPNVKGNLYDVKTYIEQIADSSTKLVVLPENFALMPENDEIILNMQKPLEMGQFKILFRNLQRLTVCG